jgi:membrane-bound metal-dependent hydrolase YbcI (DUF457 family)
MELLGFRNGFKVSLYDFLTSSRYALLIILPPARLTAELLPYLPILFIIIMLTFNVLNSNRKSSNFLYARKSYILTLSFIRTIYTISFANSRN